MKLMQFDTRDTKPKLFILPIMAVIAVGVIAVFVITDFEKSAGPACITVVIWGFLSALALLNAFHQQIRYNPYSYNTIFYLGFALFLMSVVVNHIMIAVNVFSMEEDCTVGVVLFSIINSARNYIFCTAPFLIAFSTALCFSNILLIRHEGRRFVNLLGVILSFLTVAGWVFVFYIDFYATGSQFEVMIHDIFSNICASIYLYFECMLIGTIVANIIVVRYKPEKDKDVMIILGCGTRKDGTPTPLLQGRIDRAIEFAKEQKDETGKDLVFIPSGGKGSDESIPESESIKKYLIQRGIPESRIIVEDKSTTTYENMKFSKKKIEGINDNAKIAYSTTNYHVFRGGLFARRVKMRAVGIGAATKWYFWPNAAVREFVGLLSRHKLKQVLILGTMALSFIVLTILAYSI